MTLAECATTVESLSGAMLHSDVVKDKASLEIFKRSGCTQPSSSFTPSYPLPIMVKRLSMAFLHLTVVSLPSSPKPFSRADTNPTSRKRAAAFAMLAWASLTAVWSSRILGTSFSKVPTEDTKVLAASTVSWTKFALGHWVCMLCQCHCTVCTIYSSQYVCQYVCKCM